MSNVTRRTALGVGVSALAAALTACAAIPTDGEVNHYADPQASSGSSSRNEAPAGPAPGATPAEIIEGFLHAGVGVGDDYSVARSYLTESLAQTWRPDSRTLVYNSSFSASSADETSYTVTVPTSTQIDERGLATSFTTVADTDISFTLQQVDGEWRISAAPDGTVLSRTEFDDTFTPFTLYFYDPSFSYAVPDIRWFAERPTVATSLVRVLLEGPAPYLEGAVVTAVPEDTHLARNSVPIDNGTANVQLTGGQALATASALNTERLRTQLTQTLSALATVTSVQMSFNDQMIAPQSLENYREPAVNPEGSPNIVGIENNRLVSRATISDTASQQTIVETSPLVIISQPAMNYTRNYFAYTNDSQTEVWLANSNSASSVYRGTHIVQPSFSHQNWLWIAEQNGTVRVHPAGGEIDTLHTVATWLEGGTLHSLDISRDGCRALLVTSSDGGNFSAWVSAVRRSDDGNPVELISPVRLGSEINPRGASWVSDVEVFLWNTETTQTELVSLTGQNTVYDSLQGINRIVSGNGIDQAVAMTRDGGLHIVAGRSWTRIENSLSEVNYAG
ncbi:hypothetical protein A7979_08030 [Rothia nasimurium]|uniref:GerMN domain-containing protein n=1 Tax=Rothia nasimurium TaxID=85336 RepID=A0A1Y1RLS1_9MICC|nr:LpqB family beta-propeller domain-containing protein [Rothia nasimurium]ORC15279.1 hypothetical protein A7979_08030 [Rothia nasimurium]